MEIIEKIKAKIKKIFQKTPKKIRKGIAIGTLAAATVTSVTASSKAEEETQKANQVKVEQENFKDQIKYDVEKDEKQASEPNNVERANQLETEEEVEDYMPPSRDEASLDDDEFVVPEDPVEQERFKRRLMATVYSLKKKQQ